jgi:hypothetical protein
MANYCRAVIKSPRGTVTEVSFTNVADPQSQVFQIKFLFIPFYPESQSLFLKHLRNYIFFKRRNDKFLLVFSELIDAGNAF